MNKVEDNESSNNEEGDEFVDASDRMSDIDVSVFYIFGGYYLAMLGNLSIHSRNTKYHYIFSPGGRKARAKTKCKELRR